MAHDIFSLNGEWELTSSKEDLKPIPAPVPGEIHYALMDAGIIENVYAGRKAAAAAQWVADADWTYRREFSLPQSMLDSPLLFLKLHCVDTFADVYVNGSKVGSTANMFLKHRFSLRDVTLKAAGNSISVQIKSHARMTAAKAPEALERIALEGSEELAATRALVRRYQRNYNQDLAFTGQTVIGMGIGGPVEIIACPQIFIDEFNFQAFNISAQKADCQVDFVLNSDAAAQGNLEAAVSLFDPEGNTVFAGSKTPLAGDRASVRFSIESPALWWPRGYGQQNLHLLTIDLYQDANLVHSIESHVGIRQVVLVRELPGGRKTFYFKINGTKVYPRGGNLMPVDYLSAYGTEKQHTELLRLAVNANLNMLRLWGGGVQAPDEFYAACDQLGIMVWKDFHLHSHTYPDYDPGFVAEVRQESISLVKELRNHPCFTIICCGNEQQEGWEAWNWQETIDRFYGAKLIYEVLPEVAAEYCPEIPCIPNSPFGEKLSQSPVDGDCHSYGNFYNATKDPQFVTETCWYQGTYSRPETLENLMGIKVDDFNYLGWHKKWREITAQGLLGTNQYSEYHQLSSLREYLHGLEIEQLQADYQALSLLRCRSSSCNGIIYWPLNKGGPFFLYGCIDYHGRPLMSYYLLKRLFSDLVVNIYRDVDDIRIVAANAGSEFAGNLNISHYDNQGQLIGSQSKPVAFGTGNSIRLHDMANYYNSITNRWTEVLYVSLTADDRIIAEDTLFFCPWFEFEIIPGDLICSAKSLAEGQWEIEIETEHLAKLIEIEADKKMMYSDNYFTLVPGMKKTIFAASMDDEAASGITLKISSLDNPVSRTIVLEG